MSAKENKVFRAGIIPFFVDSDNSIKFMFMKPSDPAYGGPDWQIAKGRIEGDDTELEAAIREGQEELGLKESNMERVLPLGTFLGRTTFYTCQVKDMDDFDDYTYETGEVAWMTLEEFLEHGRDIHREIVTHAHSTASSVAKFHEILGKFED